MKGVQVIVALVLCGAMAVSGAVPEIKPDDTQYSTIGARNIFDLRPVPEQQKGPLQTNPPVNVKLTGMTTILGPTQAVFSTQEPGKPTPVTVVMMEGERQGGIEVEKIDMQERTAKVTIDGRPMTLHLEEPKGFGGGAPAAAAGPAPNTTAAAVAAANAGIAPRGGGAAPTQPYYGGRGGPGMTSAAPGQFNPTGATGQPDPTAGWGYGDPNTTARQVRTQTQPNFTPEQQVLLIEAQRAQALKTGDPIANILPPTLYTSQVQQDHLNQTQPPPQMPGLPGASAPPLGSKVTGNIIVPR